MENKTRLNRARTRLLIKLIKDRNNPFNWGYKQSCLGFYAGVLCKQLELGTDLEPITAIRTLFNLNSEQALNLYIAQDLEGKSLTDVWTNELNDETSRKDALKYLRKFA